jgi:predicted DNA-binding protein (MmcQ/YjbR family)
MNLERLRRYCLSLPHATNGIQWVDHVLFKVGGKMFAIASLDAAAPYTLSFKCDPETFAQLIERPGIVPAPYLARSHWVALEEFSALSDREIEDHVAASYRLVVERLPKKTRQAIAATAAPRHSPGRGQHPAT